MIVHRGAVAQEWHGKKYREPMYAMSTTKSVTSLLVGMLIADGKIKSLDQPVCAWIPEWCDESRREVTLRHLLSMTAGLPNMPTRGVHTTNDKNPFVIRLVPSKKPGTHWEYSNETVQLLSPILDAAAGEPLQDYAKRRLFEPLGMTSTKFHLDEKGHAWTYADLETTPRDLARIGELVLAKGKWNGKQIVPEEWIRLSTTPSQSMNREYGLLWWVHQNGQLIVARGYLETNIWIVPEAELVVVRMQSKPVRNAIDYWAAARPVLREMVLKAGK